MPLKLMSFIVNPCHPSSLGYCLFTFWAMECCVKLVHVSVGLAAPVADFHQTIASSSLQDSFELCFLEELFSSLVAS